MDEQMTMTSMRLDQRPHVHNIFPPGPPTPSTPVDVPGSLMNNDELFSSSAPISGMDIELNDRTRYTSKKRYSIFFNEKKPLSSSVNRFSYREPQSTQSARNSIAYDQVMSYPNDDIISTRSVSSNTSSDDEFIRLKMERAKERRARASRKYSRNQAPFQDQDLACLNDASTSDHQRIDNNLLLSELVKESELSMTRFMRNRKDEHSSQEIDPDKN